MNRIEGDIPPDINFSVDPEVIKRAKRLLGTEPDEERSIKWLHSPEKQERERRLAKVLRVLSLPLFPILSQKILAVDGQPALYNYTVAFPGPDGTLIGPRKIAKFRTLKWGADKEKSPFETTVFQGGKKDGRREKNPRVHSKFGRNLRVLSLDEIPQFESVANGDLALIGPRGLTEDEIEGIHIVFNNIDQNREFKKYLSDYLEIMARVAPLPGIAGLYAAIRKKDLTPTERLLLGKLYCQGATREGDNRILVASLITTLKRTGAR